MKIKTENRIEKKKYIYIYIYTHTYIQVNKYWCTMHLADAFIQSDLDCIQVTVFYI